MTAQNVQEQIESGTQRRPKGEVSIGCHAATVAEKDSWACGIAVPADVHHRPVGHGHTENLRRFRQLPSGSYCL